MYNLGDKKNLLAVDGNAVTPRTPEIVATLAAWFPTDAVSTAQTAAAVHKLNQCDSHSSCSGSPLDSPAGYNAPPSLEQTRSKLVRASLKRSLEMKRKNSSGGDSSETETMKLAKLEYNDSTDDDDCDDDTDSKSTRCGLTPADEERRRKRRERNKLAATKCREKKRERTKNLVTDCEKLENLNKSLKAQVLKEELERQKVISLLQSHTCLLPAGTFELPAPPTISVTRFLGDPIGCAAMSDTTDATRRNSAANSEPIPSVHTIGKFGQNGKASGGKTRSRGQQRNNAAMQQQQQQLLLQQSALSPQSNHIQPASNANANPTSTTTNSTTAPTVLIEGIPQQQQQQQRLLHAQQQQQLLQQPLPQHQQPPIIDINYLNNNAVTINTNHLDLTTTVDLLLPATYCKASPNDYAMSPDSGFIKSPVDSMGSNYSSSTTSIATVAASNNSHITNISNTNSTSASSNNSFMHQLHHMTNNNNNNNNSNNVNNNNMIHLKNDYIPSPTSSQHPCNNNSLLDNLHHDQYGQQQQQLLTNGQCNTLTMHGHQPQQQQQQHQHQQNQQHNQQQQQQLGAGLIGPGDGSEFALKCELVDSVVNSPYTTEQSADRFLYEAGVDGTDSSLMFSDNSNLCVSELEQSDLKMLVAAEQFHQQQQQQHLSTNSLHGALSVQQQHNNHHHQSQQHQQHQHQQHHQTVANTQQQQLQQQQQQHQHHHQQQQLNMNGTSSGGNNIGFTSSTNVAHCTGIGSTNGINNNGNSVFDNLQHGEFLSLSDGGTVLGNDTHFTDLDSGITTYANFLANGGSNNNNGCMA